MKKSIYWMPRILSILFICFLSLFSLDVFQPGMSAAEIALGLFMHNIPSIILIVLLIISWRREIIGALTYFAASEIALISLNDSKIKLMADAGDKKAIQMKNIIQGCLFMKGALITLSEFST
ncbi:DUF7670 domain-containing protein [Proteocatella sphenisci]|uniref:DUF7670 domain-containing protein n=1 Tax=Proteocatella sphenisci TaxID=181070 RepID=UPI0004B31F4E|nr:hypothetical protein [Proteocatella sphenisci]